MTQVLHICQSCLPTGTESLPDAVDLQKLEANLQKAGLDVAVKPVDCLNVCNAPTVMSLQATNRASYVFSAIDIAADESDIAATCQAHLEADKGWIENAMACGRLRHCLVARLPAAE